MTAVDHIVQFKRVTKRFGQTTVLDAVDLNIGIGEVVVLIGPSGSGKSTLLRCINALEQIDGGDLIVDGISVLGGAKKVREIRQEAGMVFQQFNLFPQLTALENVAFGPRQVRGMGKREAEDLARELLTKVGLAARADHYPSELSGGQQQRVAIARALAVKPKLMLFDEPTSALDPELRQEVLRVMQSLAEEGMTMVVVTHEMAFARKVGTRLIFMEHGHITVDGPSADMLDTPPNQRLRDFLQHVE
ncbi:MULTISPECIES: glutamine ABC transporter ATP-binding protein GlnQ [Ralstonia solanacearum species complex]|uniref:High-affinity glutamine transport protein, ABC transporter, ATP binding component n=2 Tax=Ralstonia syzygii TaxID=28097 RepID=G3A001_9RALS|nr:MULTISPECIES: glutamine ABC transporter ATP-binding protein GlnQ [Ralstonia solanacearum species complex]CAH0445105.1 Glutamine transport ATP-binding protein GlnQ [Ralstonia syzygii subsp. syzygii]AMP37160.1 glutamine ABC transporter ATP-binding protein [Ralstonia solanacearum]AXV85976.1 glutamine ABC transporter ATP-binding protein [Ralstonia solanacearum]AXW05482.1 glutamine ABC transporter ATP-binding protein [Ralstonia solanacearum]AXW23223.1 glutamine ABC transporter ATP-binding protei